MIRARRPSTISSTTPPGDPFARLGAALEYLPAAAANYAAPRPRSFASAPLDLALGSGDAYRIQISTAPREVRHDDEIRVGACHARGGGHDRGCRSPRFADKK